MNKVCSANGCNQEPVEGKTMCQIHLDKLKTRALSNRYYWQNQGLCGYCKEHRPLAVRENGRLLTKCEVCNRKKLDRDFIRQRTDPDYIEARKEGKRLCAHRASLGLTNGQNLTTSREHIIPRVFFRDLGMPFEAADKSWNIRDGEDFRENSRKSKKLTDEALALIKEHGLPLRADWKERYGYLPKED